MATTTINSTVLAAQTTPTGEPYLIRGITSQFRKVWDDNGSGTPGDVTIFEPQPTGGSGFYYVGHYAQGDHNDPAGAALLLKEVAGSGTPLLAAPIGFKKVWDTDGSKASTAAFWYPVPPDGYVSLGVVVTANKNTPTASTFPLLRCVRMDWATYGTSGIQVWNDDGSGASKDLAIYAVGTPGCFTTQGNYGPFVADCFILKS